MSYLIFFDFFCSKIKINYILFSHFVNFYLRTFFDLNTKKRQIYFNVTIFYDYVVHVYVQCIIFVEMNKIHIQILF
jgi:hypothetical protein